MMQQKAILRIGLTLLCAVSSCCAQSPAQSASSTSSAAGGPVAKFQFHLQDDMALTSIVWSPDGRFIAASSTTGNKIHIWDVEKKKRLPELERTTSNAAFQELSWNAHAGLAVCDGHSGKVKLLDEATWKVTRVLSQADESACIATAFSSDGAQFAALGNLLSVYDTKSWKLIRSLDIIKDVSHGIPFAVKALAYVPGTHTILLGGADWEGVKPPRPLLGGQVFVLKPDDVVPSWKFQAYTLIPHSQGPDVTRLVVSPDGRQVATGTETGSGISGLNLVTASVHIFSLSDGSLLGAPLDDQDFSDQTGLIYTPD